MNPQVYELDKAGFHRVLLVFAVELQHLRYRTAQFSYGKHQHECKGNILRSDQNLNIQHKPFLLINVFISNYIRMLGYLQSSDGSVLKPRVCLGSRVMNNDSFEVILRD